MAPYTRAFPTADPRAGALGLINWNYEPEIAAVSLAPTSQTIYFSSIWLPAGVSVGNLYFWIAVAGAGTQPTSVVVGLDNGVTMQAQSGELKANAALTTVGFQKVPLAAAFTPPQSGYYRICYLSNGVFGTTPLQLANRTTTSGSTSKQALLFEPWGTGGTAQTALPANGSALPAVVIASNAIWCGAGA